MKFLGKFVLSLSVFVLFPLTALATDLNCVDISGATRSFVPPDSGVIVFDKLNNLPSTQYEACISNDHRETFVNGANVEAFPLKGYAWDDNAGWLQFDWKLFNAFSIYQVSVDENGYLYGYIWNDNLGWIILDWWRIDPVYTQGKNTPGAPKIDLLGGQPYAFRGYAWNDRVGWFDLRGATTMWRPPKCIQLLNSPFCLGLPEKKDFCQNLVTDPYLEYYYDWSELKPFTIKLFTQPAVLVEEFFTWDSTDINATFSGNKPVYEGSSRSEVYQPTLQSTNTITVKADRDPQQPCVKTIKILPPYQNKCGASPINYLQQCDENAMDGMVYCNSDCTVKEKPKPEEEALRYCGNRIKDQDHEECDRGLYGGFNDDKSFCTSDCKRLRMPLSIAKDLSGQFNPITHPTLSSIKSSISGTTYPFMSKTPNLPIDHVIPANPLTHKYETCFCLKDIRGNCTEIKGPITDMTVTVEYENSMMFDQGLENIRRIKCDVNNLNPGKKANKGLCETELGLQRYNQNKFGDFGEAAIIALKNMNGSELVYGAQTPDKKDDPWKHSVSLKLGPQVAKEGKLCLEVKAYTPTSGANAFDENHNGVIDVGDYFYDDKDNDMFRIKMTRITYELGGVGSKFEYAFSDNDGYFHFRAPLELTRIDPVDGKDFIHAIVENTTRFLTYVTRVVPESSMITHVPTADQIKIKLLVDRLEIGTILWFDIDTILDRLKLNTQKLRLDDFMIISVDDEVELSADKFMGLNDKGGDVTCNSALSCEVYLKPFYQDKSSKSQKIDEGKDAQIISEISFDANIEEVGLKNSGLGEGLIKQNNNNLNIDLGLNQNYFLSAKTKTIHFLSNQFPRGKESAIANPLADIRGTISSSSGVYTRREGQVVMTIGNIATNTVRNAVTASVSDYLRGAKVQNTQKKLVLLGTSISKSGYEISGTAGTDYASLLGGKMIYTKNDVQIKDLKTLTEDTTLVVEDANVFIDGDVLSTKRLGLVLIRSSLSKEEKGNVYIHPNTVNIYANIFADGSVFSYDGNSANISSTTGVPIFKSVLRTDALAGNQLLIEGSISSYNTVGGSVGEEKEGTYLLGDGTLTKDQEKAIPYDLNHLRYLKITRTKGSGDFEVEIKKRAVGLDAKEHNEAVYVFYKAPPATLPGFSLGAELPTRTQVNN